MAKTFDRAPDILVSEEAGKTRYLTPEGYLVCSDVRMASAKPLSYLPSEVPEIEPLRGIVVMLREPDVLFSEETLSSFQGKDVCIIHPDELLTPETWKKHSVGTILNPRRGEGADSDYLVADIIIKDRDAIKKIEGGMREVSCGYESEREQVKPGTGRFTRIIGNHLAFVDRGRCGPSCAIGDEEKMSKQKKTIIERLRAAFAQKDEAALEEALSEVSETGQPSVVVNVHGPASTEPKAEVPSGDEEKPSGEEKPADPMAKVNETLAAIMARLEALEGKKPSGDEDPAEKEDKPATDEDPAEEEEKKKVADAASVAAFRLVIADAEILSPGIKLPVVDAKATKGYLVDAACTLRKAALSKAISDSKLEGPIKKITGGKPIADMDCNAISFAFTAATEIARANNQSTTTVNVDHANFPQGPMTAAKLQEIHRASRAK